MMNSLTFLLAQTETPGTGPGWPQFIALGVFAVAAGFGVAAAWFLLRNAGSSKGDWKEGIREWLAIAIVGVGILIVGVVGVFAMLMADNDQFRDKVVSAVFPLLGAWVGAVIAYYFAKENLEAATKSTKELLNLEERLRKTMASEIMIDVSAIQGLEKVADEQAAKALKVVELQQRMPQNRTPVVGASGQPLMVVHKGTLAEYIAGKVAGGHTSPATLTLGDFEGETDAWAKKLWKKLKAFATVGPKATLADVKEAMGAKGSDCADVFVTQDGTSGTQMIGWVTNVDLGRASRP